MEQQHVLYDLTFPLQGITVPADHGYLLYSAVSNHLPSLHGDRAVGIHPIRGNLTGQRQLTLTRASELVLRLPFGRIPEAIPLAGKRLNLNGSSILVGLPSMHPLLPRASLRSRLVTIRGFIEAVPFLEAARRQVMALNIDGLVSLAIRKTDYPVEGQGIGGIDLYLRRTIRIRDKEIVGFSVQVDNLTADESIRLQETGIGGRRRFGCGIFVPTP